MPTPTSCLTCMEDEGVGGTPDIPAGIRSRPFAARFPGRCPDCDRSIVVDDQIVMVDNVAYHDGCG